MTPAARLLLVVSLLAPASARAADILVHVERSGGALVEEIERRNKPVIRDR